MRTNPSSISSLGHDAHCFLYCNALFDILIAPFFLSFQVWYGVPATAAAALDAAMRDALPHLFARDKLLLHKLVTMMSPTELMARGVPVCRAVQVPGSFIVTFPDAYHAGKPSYYCCIWQGMLRMVTDGYMRMRCCILGMH